MKYALSALVCLFLAFGSAGCSGINKEKLGEYYIDNKPLFLAGIQVAANKGTEKGLKAWAKKAPDAANEAATALIENITVEILPFLEGTGEFKTRNEIEAVLDSSVFDKFPDETKEFILAAFNLLDTYLPVPDATEKLKPEQVEYLKMFVMGVRDGCTKFLK